MFIANNTTGNYLKLQKKSLEKLKSVQKMIPICEQIDKYSNEENKTGFQCGDKFVHY